MTNILKQLEQEQIAGKVIPDFSAGDTVVVQVKVKEGSRERLQAFEGAVIAKRNRGFNSSFTVRKISHGEGVERVFPTYSPLTHSITVKRRGRVRRANFIIYVHYRAVGRVLEKNYLHAKRNKMRLLKKALCHLQIPS